MTDELDELLWQMWLDEHGEEDFDEHKTKIKQAIQALIDRECNKARIDELEQRLKIQFTKSHWDRLCDETNSWAKYVDRRIAQLQTKEEQTNE